MQLLVEQAGLAASPQLLLDQTPANREGLVQKDEVRPAGFELESNIDSLCSTQHMSYQMSGSGMHMQPTNLCCLSGRAI